MNRPFLIPAIVWGAIIFFIISMPGSQLPESGLFAIPHIDKLIHAVLFFVFSFLLAYGIFKEKKAKPRLHDAIIYALVSGILYSAFTEAIQHFLVKSRFGSIYDFMANVFGTVFGILLFRLLFKSQASRRA